MLIQETSSFDPSTIRGNRVSFTRIYRWIWLSALLKLFRHHSRTAWTQGSAGLRMLACICCAQACMAEANSAGITRG